MYIFIFIPFQKIFLLANSEYPDQKPRSAASDLGLHCLPMSQKWDARLIWVNDLYNIIMIIIIIITLFQEDNIFDTDVSLTYGPQITKTYMRLIITDRTKIIYSMYRAGEVSVHRAGLQVGYPTLLLWRGRYNLSRLKTSREW